MAPERTTSGKERTYELILHAKSGDACALEQLVTEHIGLVRGIVWRFLPQGGEAEDLVQIGTIGLLKAIGRFDVRFEVMFSTYAVPLILGEIRRHLRDDGRIKAGREIKRRVVQLRHAEESFLAEHRRAPRLSELAEAAGTDVESVLETLEAREAICGIESLDDEDKAFAARIPARDCSEEERACLIDLKSAILRLKEKERAVIILRYLKDMTQQEIANKLSISQVQVSRIERKALAFMRRNM